MKTALAVISFLISLSHEQTLIPVLEDLKRCKIIEGTCPHTNITFWLYTRNRQHEPYKLDVSDEYSIKYAPFDVKAPLKILIHGYNGWKDITPNDNIRPALFKHGKYNIISVDYEPLAKRPCYVEATVNIRLVAECTAQMLDHIVKSKGIPLAKVHIIGFSLGAHVAGMVSNHLKSGKLPRITGLDPAMPLFLISEPKYKLDHTDAKFVDVLHTNGFNMGMYGKMGDVDFYANGGVSQPGCERGAESNSCSHKRAAIYYAESVNSKEGFWGKYCKSWRTHKNKKCKKFVCEQEIMGEHTPPTARGSYFFDTYEGPPFAKGKVCKPKLFFKILSTIIGK